MSANNSTVSIKMGKGYVIFDAICVVIFIIFFLMSAYYGVMSGVFLFFVCIIGGIFNFFDRKSRKITIENNTIIEKRMLKKQKKIEFSEVDYLDLVKKNNTEIIGIYSKMGTVIKIPKYYQNVELFEEIVRKQHWRWK